MQEMRQAQRVAPGAAEEDVIYFDNVLLGCEKPMGQL